ncbi:MAG: carboxypeptidase regulatory-like domain-containing protein [Pirellulales bacterium]
MLRDPSQFTLLPDSGRLRAFVPLGNFLGLILVAVLGCQPAPVAAPVPRVIHQIQGRVVDDDGPVAGATVRWQTSTQHTTTNAKGEFTLHQPAHDLPQASPRRVTAAKPGYYIGGSAVSEDALLSQSLTISLRRLPMSDDASYRWIAPDPNEQVEFACGNCHPAILEEWRGTAHASSAANPRFLSLLTDTHPNNSSAAGRIPPASPFDWSLARELPHGVAVCASCHSPTEVAGVSLEPLASHDIDDRTAGDQPRASGIHCDFCHKIADVSLTHLGHSHGVFAMRLLRPSTGQLFFGPLDDVDRGDESMLPLQRESRLCASCHEGVLFGVPVYTTFREWQASPAGRAGKQCQSCHMTPTGQMTRMASGDDAPDRSPETLASHQLFARGIESMLRRAVRTTAHWKRSSSPSESIEATLRIVAEDVGHRVPTGFIDRHLVLRVEAYDAAGHPARQTMGPQLPVFTGLDDAGKPGRLFARILRDPAGHSPAPFWRPGVVETEDSRLIPGQPVEVRFQFESTAAGSRIERLRVRLEYRRFWDSVVREKQWDAPAIMVFDREYEL